MPEKLARKMGEVLAFGRVGQATLDKASGAASLAFGQSLSAEILSVYLEDQAKIEDLAGQHNFIEDTSAKAEKTTAKLFAMRDLYIGEEWDNPVELLEWLGFFEGAAVVHWNLIVGISEEIKDVNNLARERLSAHQRIFENVNEAIKSGLK